MLLSSAALLLAAVTLVVSPGPSSAAETSVRANAAPASFPPPGGWPGAHSVLYAVLSSVVIIAVFMPLTVARYRRVASRCPNVTVATFENLFLVHYARQIEAGYILRGVRNEQDYSTNGAWAT